MQRLQDSRCFSRTDVALRYGRGHCRRLSVGLALGLALMLLGSLAGAAVKVPARPVLSPVAVGCLAHAGIIFGGTVLEVRPLVPRQSGEVPLVQITFRVEQSVRGSRVGQTLVVREWAGTWMGHPQYRTGERVFVFLYKPNRAGITSELGGFAAMRMGADGQLSAPPGWLVPPEDGDTPLAPGPGKPLSGRAVGTPADWAKQVRTSLGIGELHR